MLNPRNDSYNEQEAAEISEHSETEECNEKVLSIDHTCSAVLPPPFHSADIKTGSDLALEEVWDISFFYYLPSYVHCFAISLLIGKLKCPFSAMKCDYTFNEVFGNEV